MDRIKSILLITAMMATLAVGFLDGASNIIFKNTVRAASTYYEIVADNNVGVIFPPPDSGAISGITGGAGLGTTDPWANFAY